MTPYKNLSMNCCMLALCLDASSSSVCQQALSVKE